MVQCALVPQEETPTIGIRSVVPMEQMQSFFGESYGRLFEEISREHIKVTGMPFGRYRGLPTDKVDVEAGVPIAKPASLPSPSDGGLYHHHRRGKVRCSGCWCR